VTRRFRQFIKRIIPRAALEARRRWLLNRAVRSADRMFAGKSAPEIFSEIYRKGLWGRLTNGSQFCSGHGSHIAKHVEPYVEATGAFLSSLGAKPDVVDLGCGDFNVGSRLRPYCGRYVACDVAAPVVEANRKGFADADVEFRQLDIIECELPPGEVVLIRQVLQHLSNADIQKIVGKLYNYRFLVLTEVVPAVEFIPNLDQPTGVSSRMARGLMSGVVLTAPPFLLKAKAERVLCVSYDEDSLGRLVTTVYELK
jgi:hypothetical protein